MQDSGSTLSKCPNPHSLSIYFNSPKYQVLIPKSRQTFIFIHSSFIKTTNKP
ncbi:hypothetical protein HMPREF9151_00941 [Hoylesella saccharolytica F0055]|uniref:Uncharacterized protein n=1 Tax=Hoylesella saccharolytica F0055 TaxID=1127699 RepID=L1NF63_9BACT|nr:hypothetical protein HMPREF9151_00941 [Hoylesella saccharolytica F0055]